MKQMDVTKKKIGDTYFYITPFPAFTAARVSGVLSNTLAPMLSDLSVLFGGGDGNDAANDFLSSDMDSLIPALAGSLSQLDGDKFENLAKQLLVDYKNVAYEDEDGEAKRLTYETANELFCADLGGMILLGIEVIRVNFSGFFKKLLGPFGNLQSITEQVTGKALGTKNGAT